MKVDAKQISRFMLKFKTHCDYFNKPAIYLIRKKHQIPGELRGG